MQQRLPSLLDPPIGFAHRGASALAPENTIEAFRLALRLGATGLESDVWVTADGVAVLDHDGVVRSGVRKRPLREVPRHQLPEHIPTLTSLFDECGDDFHLSLDVKDPDDFVTVAATVRDHGGDVPSRTWLCTPHGERLAALRDELADFRLVHSTRLARLKEGPERHAAWLADAGIDTVNMRHDDWTGGLVVLYHRFDRLVFSWDLQFEHTLEPAIRMGVDAVYSDHPDLMMDAIG